MTWQTVNEKLYSVHTCNLNLQALLASRGVIVDGRVVQLFRNFITIINIKAVGMDDGFFSVNLRGNIDTPGCMMMRMMVTAELHFYFVMMRCSNYTRSSLSSWMSTVITFSKCFFMIAKPYGWVCMMVYQRSFSSLSCVHACVMHFQTVSASC